MEELGYPNFDYRGFVGLAVPAKTSALIIAFLNKHLNEVVQSEIACESEPPAAHSPLFCHT